MSADPRPLGDELARVLRDDHLAAVRGRRDPCGPVDVDPDVVAVGDERLTRMEAHAHPQLAFGPVVGEERLLGLLGGREPFARIGEDDEEAVALRVDLETAVPNESCP